MVVVQDEAYACWAATYPGAADALERVATAQERVDEVWLDVRDMARLAALQDVAAVVPVVVVSQESEVVCPQRTGLAILEEWLSSGPCLKARVVGFLRTWPAHAPLMS